MRPSLQFILRYIFDNSEELNIKEVFTAIRQRGGRIKHIGKKDNLISVSITFNSLEKQLQFEEKFRKTPFYCFTINYREEIEQENFLESLSDPLYFWTTITIKKLLGKGWSKTSEQYWYLLASLINNGYVSFDYDICEKVLEFEDEYKNFIFTHIYEQENSFLYWCAYKWLQRKNSGKTPQISFLSTFHSAEKKFYLQVGEVNQEYIVRILSDKHHFLYALRGSDYYILKFSPTKKFKKSNLLNIEQIIDQKRSSSNKTDIQIEIENGIKEVNKAESRLEKKKENQSYLEKLNINGFPNSYKFTVKEISALLKFRKPTLKDEQEVRMEIQKNNIKFIKINGKIHVTKNNVERLLEIKKNEVKQNKEEYEASIKQNTMDVLIIPPKETPQLITLQTNKKPFDNFFTEEYTVVNYNGYKCAFQKSVKRIDSERNISIGKNIYLQNIYGTIMFIHYYNESLKIKDAKEILKSLNFDRFLDKRLVKNR